MLSVQTWPRLRDDALSPEVGDLRLELLHRLPELSPRGTGPGQLMLGGLSSVAKRRYLDEELLFPGGSGAAEIGDLAGEALALLSELLDVCPRRVGGLAFASLQLGSVCLAQGASWR